MYPGDSGIKIAVASGKGGTGKTTIAVNLALALCEVQLFDCDVEAPDCNLFLGFELEKIEDVYSMVPEIDPEKCSLCGKCSDFCRYNALAALPKKVLVFPFLCHGCGGCRYICPQKAIRETPRSFGIIEKAKGEAKPEFFRGLLKPGEATATPVIRALRKQIDTNKNVIIDAPPGTACPALASVEETDYCVLVTESTPFGFHDLLLAIDMVKALKVPFGVVLNRDGIGDGRVEDYCKVHSIPVLLKVPNDQKIAKLYSEGRPFVQEIPEWKERFEGMFKTIKTFCQKPAGRLR